MPPLLPSARKIVKSPELYNLCPMAVKSPNLLYKMTHILPAFTCRMFKWKVSTLGGGKKLKSSSSQKLNNMTLDDRKQFGEEETLATQEVSGCNSSTLQLPKYPLSTGYYPETQNFPQPLVPAQYSLQNYGQVDMYPEQNSNAFYSMVSHQSGTNLPEIHQKGIYSGPYGHPNNNNQQYDSAQPPTYEARHGFQLEHEPKTTDRETPTSNTAQTQAYLAWVNWQLQKKPGMKAIKDLSQLKEDKVLATLVQIVSSKPLIGLDNRPQTQAVCLINMERILAHLAKQRVKVATITPHDLAGGNIKAIMKLIQSLAAFYKPHSVGSGRVKGSENATPNLSQPFNRKVNESSSSNSGQPSMGLTVRAVATLRRPLKTQPSENKAAIYAPEIFDRKRVNLSMDSLDRNMVNAQIQASLKTTDSSSQTILTNPKDSRVKNITSGSRNNGTVPPTPLVSRSARIDRKPTSAERNRSGSVPPIMNTVPSLKSLPTAVIPTVKFEKQKTNSPVKRTESKYADRRLQLNRSNSAAAPKVTKMDCKSKSESFLRSTEEKKDTPFKFWESLIDKGRRKLPESPKIEKKIEEKPLDLSADDSIGESCKANSKSDSKGNLSPLESRGEVEGSSNNTSPITSDHEESHHIRLISASIPGSDHPPKIDVYDRMEKKLHEVQKWLFETVTGDSENKIERERNKDEGIIPYDVVLKDLHTARSQLVELQSLLLSASSDVGQQEPPSTVRDSRGTSTVFDEDTDAYGVLKPIPMENLRVSDLILEETSPEKLRQALMKSALRQHRLSSEKAELLKKLEEKEWQINELKKQTINFDRMPRLSDNSGSLLATTTPQMHRRNKGREELQIARDALTSLRSNFR
ncbi:uncharacterized protein LOC136027430 [Artemia franciscana]|uniref:uncharacterized protein LOC136027430 n=1 Tax=Artemia franciscana TaxID=6661 RepID=UPI0032DAE171